MKYKYLFGPVPSRRLGVSLGLDIIPHKTCSMNCVYCECGPTTCLTVERREYVPADEVCRETDDYLQNSPELDYVTFAGSGEPTLNSQIGNIIGFLKTNYPDYKVAILTNGTLFHRKEVIESISGADLIIPSLDAVTLETWKRINRPHASLDPEKILAGLVSLREHFAREIWLEIFIVPGLNDTESELKMLKDAVARIKPDRVQLNSLDRPGSEKWVKSARKIDLAVISDYLGFGAEPIWAPGSWRKISWFNEDIRDSILATIRRRPCTVEDMAKFLNLRITEINKYLKLMLRNGMIEREIRRRGEFFKIKAKTV